jgi:hypothetical protein
MSGGAPDSVRCARTSLGEQTALGTRRRRTTINHWTVRWCTGLSGESSAAKSSLLGNVQQRTTKIHRTVRWCTRLSGGAPDCPVKPTVDCANGRPCNPRVTRGRANGRQGHRTVRCAPDSVRCANCRKTAMVGCARKGRRSRTGQLQGLSGAPPNRRQELPSKVASNGS